MKIKDEVIVKEEVGRLAWQLVKGEQEDNRKELSPRQAGGLNRKVNGECKEHTRRVFRQTRRVYLKQSHNVFAIRNTFKANFKTWLLLYALLHRSLKHLTPMVTINCFYTNWGNVTATVIQ